MMRFILMEFALAVSSAAAGAVAMKLYLDAKHKGHRYDWGQTLVMLVLGGAGGAMLAFLMFA